MKTTTLQQSQQQSEQQSQQQSELKSVPQSIAPTTSQQTGLVARWHMIDGKLVCQWTSGKKIVKNRQDAYSTRIMLEV
jgi:hypothetical protein